MVGAVVSSDDLPECPVRAYLGWLVFGQIHAGRFAPRRPDGVVVVVGEPVGAPGVFLEDLGAQVVQRVFEVVPCHAGGHLFGFEGQVGEHVLIVVP